MTAIEDTLPETAGVAPGEIDGVVDELVEMNSDDWTTFADNGVGPGREVRVEFEFSTRNEAAAESLAEDLQSEGYNAEAAPPDADYDDWGVTGATQPVTVTEQGLAEWVRRLAAYGLDHDGSVLDGWAADLD